MSVIYGSFYVAKSDYNLINSKARSTLSTPAISDMVSPEDQSHIRVSMPYTWGINMKDMVQFSRSGVWVLSDFLPQSNGMVCTLGSSAILNCPQE